MSKVSQRFICQDCGVDETTVVCTVISDPPSSEHVVKLYDQSNCAEWKGYRGVRGDTPPECTARQERKQ